MTAEGRYQCEDNQGRNRRWPPTNGDRAVARRWWATADATAEDTAAAP